MRAQARIAPAASAAWRHGGDTGLELLLLIQVRDEGEQQLGTVGEVQVQRLPGDAHRARQRRHGGGGALLFGDLPGGVENPRPRA